MARTQNKSENRESNAPAYIAWHVTEREEKGFWTRVGAAWDHKDGEGFTLQLEMMPMTGRIVLRRPQEQTPDEK